MKIRDRIRELRRVPAAELRPNPRNWRTHSERQRNALQGVLAEIGYAGALLARELEDGSLELIDGHLRAETTPDMPVPVLILDVTEQEADKILATHDPLANLAGVDSFALQSLLADVQSDNEAVQAMLAELAESNQMDLSGGGDDAAPDAVAVPRLFQIVVECDDESQQQTLYERLTREEYKCRLMTL
jgi:hypothetical protein